MKKNDNRIKLVNSYLCENLHGNNNSLDNFLCDIERDIIDKALKVCNGHKKNAAILLNLKYSTLIERVKRFKLETNKKLLFENVLTSLKQ